MRPYRRRIYVTKKDFQGRFILRFVLVAILVGMAGTSVFNVLAWKKLEQTLYTLHLSATSTGDLLLPELRMTALFMTTLIGLLTWIAQRRLITSISGPLFRMKKDVGRMAGGDLSFEIVLRTGDRFRELADEINAAAGALRDRWTAVARQGEVLAEALQRLEGLADDPEQRKEAAEELVREGRKLREALSAFRVS